MPVVEPLLTGRLLLRSAPRSRRLSPAIGQRYRRVRVLATRLMRARRLRSALRSVRAVADVLATLFSQPASPARAMPSH
jgi:hypothetical protein